MLDEKRKKLEELRNRRIKPTTNETSPAVLKQGTNTEPASATQSKKVDDILKDLENKRENNKYRTDHLLIVRNITENISGITPIRNINDKDGKSLDVYDEYVQCNIDAENNYVSDEEPKQTIKSEKGYRKSIISLKSKNNFTLSQKKPLEDEKKLDKIDDTNANSTNFSNLSNKTEKNKIVFNDDYRKTLLQSNELTDFLSKNSKYIERTLGEKDIYDSFKTYYDENDGEGLSKRSWVTPALDFYDVELCHGRSVNNLDWSIKHQELLLTSYTKSVGEFNMNHSNGLILLWSLAMRKAPEFTFYCQTEITSATFHKFNPKLVIGATYTGQIMIWDTRGKSLPVQKTPPGGKYHSHPIYCLGVNGSTNSNNIVSVSNNGTLCTWSNTALHKPTKKIELKSKKKRQLEKSGTENISTIQSQNIDEMGAICMATQENDNNNIFIGTDDSDIYQVYAHQGNDVTDNIIEVYRKHTGPITSIDMHPGDIHKNSNFSHLFLSSSTDWTINLWSKNFSDSPILTFDVNDDYVYDTKWHPTNPSLFAVVGGNGKLDLWDLNKDIEMPSISYEVGKNALNKVSWSSDGKKICTGDISGKVTVLNVEKELSNSKVEDSSKFEKVISIAKNNKKTY